MHKTNAPARYRFVRAMRSYRKFHSAQAAACDELQMEGGGGEQVEKAKRNTLMAEQFNVEYKILCLPAGPKHKHQSISAAPT